MDQVSGSFQEGYEFVVVGHAGEAALAPEIGRMSDALLIGCDEVPPNKSLLGKRLAAEGEKTGGPGRLNDDFRPRLEDEKTILAEVAVLPHDLEGAGDNKDRPLDMFAIDPIPGTRLKMDLGGEEIRKHRGW